MDKPKAYKQGWVEFYKLKFKVTPDTLIPRPETELLVDEVLKFVSKLPTTNYQLPPLTILDLGTGAGNIAISLAKNLHALHTPGVGTGTQIVASDISEEALAVAKQNAKLHGAEDKITFLRSDLLSAFCHPGVASLQHDEPDIIVTNLPYIPSARIPYLDSSVKDFEPLVALDGGKDGFEVYRKLFKQIKDSEATPRGWQAKLIIGEIDYTHGELAVDEALKYFPEAEVEVKNDLAHKQRILRLCFTKRQGSASEQ